MTEQIKEGNIEPSLKEGKTVLLSQLKPFTFVTCTYIIS